MAAKNGIIVNVDFDGVIANFVLASLTLNGDPTTPSIYRAIDRFDHPLITKNLLHNLHNPALYEELIPYLNTDKAMKGMMSSGYTVRIASSRPPETLEMCCNWLELWDIPFDAIIFGLHSKVDAGPDILIEDRAESAVEYAETRGPVILLKRPWNQSKLEQGRIPPDSELKYPIEQVGSWDGAIQALRRQVYVLKTVKGYANY